MLRDLYALSPNSAFFERLRAGKLEATPGPVPDAVVRYVSSDDASGLYGLRQSGDEATRVRALGELTLAMHALEEGGHSQDATRGMFWHMLTFASDLAGYFQKTPPPPGPLFDHASALREWTHLLALLALAIGLPEHHPNMLGYRSRLTTALYPQWPNLVGAALVELGLACESVGRDFALKCFEGVRADLAYLLDHLDNPAFPEYEKQVAVHWLQRAAEESHRMAPDPGKAAQARVAREARIARGWPTPPSRPRFGPIARTYLADLPYLALILRHLRSTGDIVATCDHFGCTSRDAGFYLSAMESYALRSSVLAGVTTTYDDAHERVFAALDLASE